MAGRPPAVSDEEILQVLVETTEPFLSTAEVAEKLGLGQEGTVRRLNELAEADRIQRKTVGNSYAWWLPGKIRVLKEGEIDGPE